MRRESSRGVVSEEEDCYTRHAFGLGHLRSTDAELPVLRAARHLIGTGDGILCPAAEPPARLLAERVVAALVRRGETVKE